MQTALQIIIIAVGAMMMHIVYKKLDKQENIEEVQRVLEYKSICDTLVQFESFESPTIETCKPGSLWHNATDHTNYYYDGDNWIPMDFDSDCCDNKSSDDLVLGFYNCPNCGAPVSNHSHCEYCGTIFK